MSPLRKENNMENELYMQFSNEAMVWAAKFLAVIVAMYIVIRLHNFAQRRVGYDNYRNSPLDENVMLRFPTATGSESAKITGHNLTHIKIRYENNDVGGLSLIDFDKSNYRIVPNETEKTVDNEYG